jgi:hypothetical protein
MTIQQEVKGSAYNTLAVLYVGITMHFFCGGERGLREGMTPSTSFVGKMVLKCL